MPNPHRPARPRPRLPPTQAPPPSHASHAHRKPRPLEATPPRAAKFSRLFRLLPSLDVAVGAKKSKAEKLRQVRRLEKVSEEVSLGASRPSTLTFSRRHNFSPDVTSLEGREKSRQPVTSREGQSRRPRIETRTYNLPEKAKQRTGCQPNCRDKASPAQSSWPPQRAVCTKAVREGGQRLGGTLFGLHRRTGWKEKRGRKKKEEEEEEEKKKDLQDIQGLISVDRSSKATQPLTIPRPIQVVCKGSSPRNRQV